MDGKTFSENGVLAEVKSTGMVRRVRSTDPDAFTDPDSARVRARQLGCIGIRKYDAAGGGFVWMPCTNESDYRRQMGTSHSGRLQRRREIETEVRRFIRGKSLEEIDQKSGSYTKPELRERIKNRIMAGSNGGRPGQWSARKAQLLAQEYRKAGGGYKGGKDKRQRSLTRWTRQDWTTSDGKPANRPGGMRRYLPRAAWARLSPGQIRATNRKKIQGSRSGSQFVANTESAMRAARTARKQLNELMFNQKALGATIGSTRRTARGVAARFDPNARDADLDKLIQEGTIWERPDTNLPEVAQTAARRMRRVDAGGLIGAASDDKKGPKGGFQKRRQDVDGGTAVVKKGTGKNLVPFFDSRVPELMNYLIDNGMFFSRMGAGDHFVYAKDFHMPDGTIQRREFIVHKGLDYRTLRDEAVRRGFLPSIAKGKFGGGLLETLEKLGRAKLTGDQKKTVREAFNELAKLSPDGEIESFPGFRAVGRRAQEIAEAPIPLSEVEKFLRSDESGNIKRQIENFESVGEKAQAKIDNYVDAKRVINEVAKEAQISPNSPDSTLQSNLANRVHARITADPDNHSAYLRSLRPGDLFAFIRDSNRPNYMQDRIMPTGKDATVHAAWRASTDADRDPLNSLTQAQLDALETELNSLPSSQTGREIMSDVDLVSQDGPLRMFVIDANRANIPSDLLTAISVNDKKQNPFWYYAEWRQGRIDEGTWTSNLDEAAGLVGSMSGMARGDGKRRLTRRVVRAMPEDGLTGSMTGDERRRDYMIKRRRWQAEILSRVMLHNAAEKIRLDSLGPDEPREQLPFQKWFEQFGSLDVALITGGGPGTSSFSHRVVDQLFNRLTREWGARETAVFGDKPDFKIWDAPMSQLDIENLAANKREIVGAFLDEMKRLDPASPFSAFSKDTATDDEIDMLWRAYVIPELLKTDSKMPREDLPFTVDPAKQESIRNYADYLAMRKLGLESGISDEEFSRAVDDLFVQTPGKAIEDFVQEINDAYDEFKRTGELPGEFTDEELINPNTGNIYTEEEWRSLMDTAGEQLAEKTSAFMQAQQEFVEASQVYGYLFNIGLKLGYLKPEDMENMDEDLGEIQDAVDEIDPLEELDVTDLTFDPGNRTKLASHPAIGWIFNLFSRGGRDWAYPLAEKYHSYDIQQHRYAPPPEEFDDMSKIDWDKFLEVLEHAEQHGDDDVDLPGTKTVLSKARELKAKRISDHRKKYLAKTKAGQNDRDTLWNALEVDGLTPMEIAVKYDVEFDVVDKVLKDESKRRGNSRQQFSSLIRKAESGLASREDTFQQDLLARELARLQKLGRGNIDNYHSSLLESREYYKKVNKQANAAYSQARRRYAELLTLGYWLLQGLPDGTKDFDPAKESKAAFKNRWLTALNEKAGVLAQLAHLINAQQWDPQDRMSASQRVLDRSQKMISRLDDEIAQVEKTMKLSELDSLRQRHQISAISQVKEIARQAVRGQYPNMSDDEIDRLLGEGGVTGSMASSLRGASRGRKARALSAYSSRETDDRRGLLRRIADMLPRAKSNPRVMALVDWFDNDQNLIPVPTGRRKRTREVAGELAASSRDQLRARRMSNLVRRADAEDFGLVRSPQERSIIRGITRDARKSKVNVSRYFDGRDDMEDVKWSSNDWSYAKTKPIRGADMVVYRINPNERDKEKAIEVLVISRKSGPFTGARALPGGLNDEGETLVETATREMQEEVGISADGMQVRNLGIVQSRDWDPRFVEGVTVQGMAVKVPYTTEATAGSDAKKATFVPLSEILSGDSHIAFGHATFLREALKGESPKSAKKLDIHERAARVRNRRLIEQINERRAEAGQKLFPLASDDEIRTGFNIIRPSDSRYGELNDPFSGADGVTGALSERYDIRQNQDGTFDIVDTQNGNSKVAGPFKSRKQAVYGAIRKDRDPSFDPNILLGRRTRKAGAKKAKRVVTPQPEPVQLSLFEDNDTQRRLDQSGGDGVTGAITSAELFKDLGMTPMASTIPDDRQKSTPTNSHYYGSTITDPISAQSYSIDAARYNGLWVPYRDSVDSVVPDAEMTSTPTIYIIGGPPGSLKTTLRESGLIGIPSRQQAVTVDPDEAKLLMPEYISLLGQAYPGSAGLVHEESKEMVENALIAATEKQIANLKVMGKGKDIVYDSLGQLNNGDIRKAIKKAKANGFRVVGFYFMSPQNVSGMRLTERRKRTGRSVSKNLHQQSVYGISNLLSQELPARNLFDELAVYDTSDARNIQRAIVYVRDASGVSQILQLDPPQGRTISKRSGAALHIEPVTNQDGTTSDSAAAALLGLEQIRNL